MTPLLHSNGLDPDVRPASAIAPVGIIVDVDVSGVEVAVDEVVEEDHLEEGRQPQLGQLTLPLLRVVPLLPCIPTAMSEYSRGVDRRKGGMERMHNSCLQPQRSG
jgi:hypothetical protein